MRSRANNQRKSTVQQPLKDLNEPVAPNEDKFLFVVVFRQTKQYFSAISAVIFLMS